MTTPCVDGVWSEEDGSRSDDDRARPEELDTRSEHDDVALETSLTPEVEVDLPPHLSLHVNARGLLVTSRKLLSRFGV